VGIAGVAAALAGLFAALGWARFATYHNETFDLAFYTRMAWGYVHAEMWEPIVGGNVAGLHLSPVLLPLGLIGELSGSTPAVLIAAQAAAVTAAAWPLARIGHRRLGDAGAILAAGAWLLYPNLGHVTTYEFHPGTVAVLPMAWMLEGLDRGSARTMVLGALGVLACREDLALVTALAGLVAWRTRPELRRAGRLLAAGSLVYASLFALVLHPLLGPERGSMQLHFGKWGDSSVEVAASLLTSPGALLTHLGEPERLVYLPKLLLPLALLPLARPRWLVIASPLVVMNLLSEWPTTVELDSHYQTTLLPMLVAGAADGAGVIARGLPARWVATGALAAVAASHLLAGGTPIAADFHAASFRADARSAAAARALASVPEDASVQAPYALLPHLAERQLLGPPPPPDRDYDVLVFDTWHRERYRHEEDLLRTIEEPPLRDWLARETHGLVAVEGRYLVLRRGADPRGPLVSHYIVGRADPASGRRLAACLSLRDARIEPGTLVLDLVAREACPRDLAVRIGARDEPRPRRVDLLFDGLLSPAHLRAGDRLRSTHPLSLEENARIEAHGLRVGLLRSSGARPEHDDPLVLDVDPST
jgi:uncharacterized membrane protein